MRKQTKEMKKLNEEFGMLIDYVKKIAGRKLTQKEQDDFLKLMGNICRLVENNALDKINEVLSKNDYELTIKSKKSKEKKK